MQRDAILRAIIDSIIEVFPELSTVTITENDSLHQLGANSIDRAEIIMLTLSKLKLKIPLILFAPAKNIAMLITIFANELELVALSS